MEAGQVVGGDLSELEKYHQEMEKERDSFSFIKIEFMVDMREAEKKYKEEFKKDVGLIRSNRTSFDKWLECKKYEASKFYNKHSDYSL